MINKKNEVLSKGFEQFSDAIKQFANSENYGDNLKDLFNSNAFKDLQDTLSNHNELQKWLQNTVDMREDVSSGFNKMQEKLDEILSVLSSVGGASSYTNHSEEEFVRLTKELSSTTKLKNGFMKVLDAIFQKYPDVQGDMSKNTTLKKFITRVGPARSRGRPKGSTTKKNNTTKRQRTS